MPKAEGMTKLMLLIVLVLMIVPTNLHAQAITPAEVAAVRAMVAAQRTALDDAKSRLSWTWQELQTAQAQIGAVAKERDDWKSYGDDRNAKFMNAEVRVAKARAAVLKCWLIIGGLGLAIAGYAFLKFYLRIPFL